MELKQIDISKIKPNPFQPRETFKQEELQELADNIKTHGLIEPIVVTPKEDGFLIVAGERRYRATSLAGKDKIYAIIKEYKQESDIKRDSLIENEMRENLSNNEFKAFAYGLAKSLGEPYYNKGFVNPAKLSEYITGNPTHAHGRVTSPLYDKLQDFFKIDKQASPKVKKLFEEEKLDRRTAEQIASIPDKEIQNKLADLASHKSTTEIRNEVAKHNFEQHTKQLHDEIAAQNSKAIKSHSEIYWITKISNKINSWDDTLIFASNILQITNKKEFWSKFSNESRLEAMDSLKPLKRDVDKLQHIVTKIMETISEA